MRFDKKLYVCTAAFLLPLLLVSFINEKIPQNIALALVMAVAVIVLPLLLKKRVVHDFHKRQAACVMAAIAVIMLAVHFLTGAKFGFYKTPLKLSHLWNFILPYGVSIVAMEILRSVFLAQKSKVVTAVSYVAFIWIDFLILCDVNVFLNYENFMEALGLALFPAIASNALYHYIAGKFGPVPNIAYKLIIFLFPYIIPYEPQLSDALVSLFRTFLPAGLLWLMHALYTPRSFVVAKRSLTVRAIGTALVTVITVAYMMLISMQFQYKLIIVATDSMAGAIDRGDAVIYEEYDKQPIAVNDVIIFDRDGDRIIHRVIDMKKINGQMRYFTKGDANESADSGYITDADVLGVINLKIKYLGYPTLWSRTLFE